MHLLSLISIFLVLILNIHNISHEYSHEDNHHCTACNISDNKDLITPNFLLKLPSEKEFYSIIPTYEKQVLSIQVAYYIRQRAPPIG